MPKYGSPFICDALLISWGLVEQLMRLNGNNTRSVKPAAYNAGQNRFPGRAKWCPTVAEII